MSERGVNGWPSKPYLAPSDLVESYLARIKTPCSEENPCEYYEPMHVALWGSCTYVPGGGRVNIRGNSADPDLLIIDEDQMQPLPLTAVDPEGKHSHHSIRQEWADEDEDQRLEDEFGTWGPS